MAWTETPVPPNPWVSTAGAPPQMWTPSPPCGGPIVKVTVQQKTQTLYYIASTGQTQFSLSAADMFNNNVLLDGSQALAVSKGGLRLVPDDGSGAGGYTVDLSNNTINLLWPAGASEILVVDLFWSETQETVTLGQFIGEEALIVTAPNTLSDLSRAPDGFVFTLTVEGRPFYPIAPDPAFSFDGKTITWISTTYSLAVGNEVIALYSSGGIDGLEIRRWWWWWNRPGWPPRAWAGERPARRVRQGQPAQRVQRAPLGLQARLAPQGRQERPARRVRQGQPAQRVQRAPLGLQALQARARFRPMQATPRRWAPTA